MKRILLLLALLAVSWSPAFGVSDSTNSARADRILLIEPSSMSVLVGKATLTIGPLERTNSVYTGDYEYTVFPWFQFNEQEKLAIDVSDESLTQANQGKVVTVTGTATASGKDGANRPTVIIATPSDKDYGTPPLACTRHMLDRLPTV